MQVSHPKQGIERQQGYRRDDAYLIDWAISGLVLFGVTAK
jgi:hypothetical protein